MSEGKGRLGARNRGDKAGHPCAVADQDLGGLWCALPYPWALMGTRLWRPMLWALVPP